LASRYIRELTDGATRRSSSTTSTM
jgi:hypothetical protein